MARIKGATMTHKRRKKMLKLAKGFIGNNGNIIVQLQYGCGHLGSNWTKQGLIQGICFSFSICD